ncbi:MAG: hypothetical protein WKF96_17605 [Solirubrobacteraceae bacterium]
MPQQPPHTEIHAEDNLKAVLLSRLLTSTTARNPAQPHMLCKGLALYARASAPNAGARSKPHDREMQTGPWPHANHVLRRLGKEQKGLVAEFEDLALQDGFEARLPDAVLSEFVPARLWPIVDALIDDGPAVAGQRADQAIAHFTRSRVKANRARPEGPVSKGTVERMRDGFRRVFGQLVHLREEGYPSARLAAWQGSPRLKPVGAAPKSATSSAPPLIELRRALRDLNNDISSRLRISEGSNELEALRRISDTDLMIGGLFKPLRARAALLLVLLTGGRVDAVARIRRSDYLDRRVGPPPDYREGPAVLLRPGKSLHASVTRAKPLPREAADMLDVYLLYLDRITPVLARQTYGRPAGPRPITPPHDFPLLVSGRTGFREYGQYGIRTMLSGLSPNSRGSGMLPLIVRGSVKNPVLEHATVPYVGYTPQEYRHAAQQLAVRSGQLWNEEHPANGAEPQPDPRLFGTALLDHTPPTSKLNALYGDLGTPASFEVYAGRAIEGIWRLLTGDAGSRKRPDIAALRSCGLELRAVESELDRLARRSDDLATASIAPLPPRFAPAELQPQATREEEIQLLLRDQGVLLRRLLTANDQVHGRLRDLQVAHQQHHGLTDQRLRLTERRQELAVEAHRLWYDQDRWERIPDEATDATPITGTLADFLAADPAPAELESRKPKRVRDWLTVKEFVWVAGLGDRSSVSRWLKGRMLPKREDRRPWEAEWVPVDESQGPNHRRIWAPGVKNTFWPGPGAIARLEHLLARWPQEQGWTQDEEPTARALNPLDLPAPPAQRQEGGGHAA